MILYHCGTFLLSLIAAPVLACFQRGRLRFWERYGAWDLTDRVIWFHGASAGEIAGLLPVIKKFQSERPGIGVLVTATSPTGLSAVEETVDYVRLLPHDSAMWIGRAIKNLEIVCFVSAETEIWPGLIEALRVRGVPIVMANARVAERTVMKLSWLRKVVSNAMQSVSAVLAQSKEDVDRFINLGATPDRVKLTGNSKYERSPSVHSATEAEAIRATIFRSKSPVVVLGSLRPGEEKIWFPAIVEALTKGLNLSFVIAPRHKELYQFFAAGLSNNNISFERWSEIKERNAPSSAPVVLLDGFGVLESWYSFASLAHIGGTLAPYGGHNPIEAAVYGVPLVTGPYHKTIRDLILQLKGCGAVTEVNGTENISLILNRLSKGDEELLRSGENGKAFAKAMKGATEAIFQAILKLVEKPCYPSHPEVSNGMVYTRKSAETNI